MPRTSLRVAGLFYRLSHTRGSIESLLRAPQQPRMEACSGSLKRRACMSTVASPQGVRGGVPLLRRRVLPASVAPTQYGGSAAALPAPACVGAGAPWPPPCRGGALPRPLLPLPPLVALPRHAPWRHPLPAAAAATFASWEGQPPGSASGPPAAVAAAAAGPEEDGEDDNADELHAVDTAIRANMAIFVAKLTVFFVSASRCETRATAVRMISRYELGRSPPSSTARPRKHMPRRLLGGGG
jgi:hypothetical protein